MRATLITIGAAFGLFALLAQVPPETAMSNIQAWAVFLGAQNVPAWLASPSADDIVTGVAIFGALTSFGAAYWLRRRSQIKAKAVSEAEASNQYMPLIDAARRAYSETRKTDAAFFAEHWGETPDGILSQYCLYLINFFRMPFRGVRLPSDADEPLQWSNNFSVKVDDGKAWIEERRGGGRYTNLMVRRADLPAIIDRIRQWPGPGEPTRADARLIPAAEALDIILEHYEQEWGEERAPGAHIVQAAIRFREAASRGQITAEGRKEINRHSPIGDHFSKILVRVPKDFWLTHELDLVAVLDDTAHFQACETQPENPGDLAAASMPGYAGLRVSENEVRHRWPKSKQSDGTK